MTDDQRNLSALPLGLWCDDFDADLPKLIPEALDALGDTADVKLWTRCIRNVEMLDTEPDLVLAFWDGFSRGTKHTIDEAERRGIPVETYGEALGA